MKYYSRLRPLVPGTYPEGRIKEIKNYDEKRYIDEIGYAAWGYVDYDGEISDNEARRYDLISEEYHMYYCVLSCIYEDGQSKSVLREQKILKKKPIDEYYERKNCRLLINWFGDYSKVEACIKEKK